MGTPRIERIEEHRLVKIIGRTSPGKKKKKGKKKGAKKGGKDGHVSLQLFQDDARALFRHLGREPELDRLVVPDSVEPCHKLVAIVRSQEEVSIPDRDSFEVGVSHGRAQ